MKISMFRCFPLPTIACIVVLSSLTALCVSFDRKILSSAGNPVSFNGVEEKRQASIHTLPDDRLFMEASLAGALESRESYSSVCSLDVDCKIALLFLTRGPLPLARLWERWLSNQDGHYSIYVHAEPGFKLGSEYPAVFLDREIPSQKVQWGKMSVVDAERRLIASALLDPSNQRFLLLSESCAPLWNFSFVANYLLGTNSSFVEARPQSKKHIRYNVGMLPEVSEERWRKGSQWFVITRKLGWEAISNNSIYAKFGTWCNHPCYNDEHYFQTLFSMKHDAEFEHRSVTWFKFKQRSAHPIEFKNDNLNATVLEDIRGEARCSWNKMPKQACHLIVRKFMPETLDTLLELAPHMGY